MVDSCRLTPTPRSTRVNIPVWGTAKLWEIHLNESCHVVWKPYFFLILWLRVFSDFFSFNGNSGVCKAKKWPSSYSLSRHSRRFHQYVCTQKNAFGLLLHRSRLNPLKNNKTKYTPSKYLLLFEQQFLVYPSSDLQSRLIRNVINIAKINFKETKFTLLISLNKPSKLFLISCKIFPLSRVWSWIFVLVTVPCGGP